MKRVWFDNTYLQKGNLVDEVENVLDEQNFDVELFGVRRDTDQLPKNYEIVDYGSRDLMAVCVDGKVITDQLDLDAYELGQEYIGETYSDPDGVWEITDVKVNIIPATGQKFEALIKNIQEENLNFGMESGVDIREAIYFLNVENFMAEDKDLDHEIFSDPNLGDPVEE